MIVYLDTSALFKLFAAEPGANRVRKAIGSARGTYTLLIGYAETCAGFAKAVKLGRTTSVAAAELRHDLDREWAQFGIVMPDESMIRRAGDLAVQFGLRGYDSVHFAAAESLRAGHGKHFPHFASFDRALNEAAGALGLSLLIAG